MNTLSPNLQSLLDNRLRYLPPITGAAIASVDWSAKVIEIGHKYGLHIDEMEDFQAVVLKSMIGLIAPASFETELINALALSPANAEKIIEDINIKIFGPIHDYVMRQGKPQDAMEGAGIVVQHKEDDNLNMVVPFVSASTESAIANNLGNPVDIDWGAQTTQSEIPESIGDMPLVKKSVFRRMAEATKNESPE